MGKTAKYIAGRLYRPLLARYLSVERRYAYKGIRLLVPQGVFHPGFFASTKMLLRWISRQPLENRSFLELGAGSGLISVFAARKGAAVTATDINPEAISCLEANRLRNGVSMTIVHADLFEGVPVQAFDIIAVNPPYYRKQPISYAERAWYCGVNGEYFAGFFRNLRTYTHQRSSIWMVLSDACDMDLIRRLAGQQGWVLQEAYARRNLLERHVIYTIGPGPVTKRMTIA
jgi:release factor glutamine methyltransferase